MIDATPVPLLKLPDRRQTGHGDSACGFDIEAIVDGAANALLAAKVPLGRSNGNAPEEELNLL
jgi:hypothetical protein